MTIDDIRDSILTWARFNGILSENVLFKGKGDPSIIPFDDSGIEFFRSRKIVRVETLNDRNSITIFSKLPIAKTKQTLLQGQFNTAFSEYGFQLLLDASKPFKVDQAVQAYGRFEPLHIHNDAICCGSSIGLGNLRNAGTLTALAYDDDKLYGLSCNHVVGGCSIAQPGTPVVSPGIQDISADHNKITAIGDYSRPAQMSQGLPDITPTHQNRDLACFTIRNENLVSSLQGSGDNSYDTPTRFAKVELYLPVKKWGRSTGFTKGIITYIGKVPEPIEYNVICYYGPMNSQAFKGTVYFDEIYEVTPTGSPFSLGGDSGALVVTDFPNRTPKVVGIVIAGERNKSIILPLQPALNELKLKLLSKHNSE